jgi:hypothetical protein
MQHNEFLLSAILQKWQIGKKLQKVSVSIVKFIHLYDPTRPFLMKFHFCDLNLSTYSDFGKNQMAVADSLH